MRNIAAIALGLLTLAASAVFSGCARPLVPDSGFAMQSPPEVHWQTCRPRLFLRPEPWSGGLSVARRSRPSWSERDSFARRWPTWP